MSNAGLIYVCDRQGNRVQVFQKDGTFVRNILIPNKSGKLPDKRGTAWWVAFSPDREQKFLYMMNGGTEQVHILDHASGKILSSFGRPGHQIGNFTHGHTIAVDFKGSIYVAETDWGRRIQKFKIVRVNRSKGLAHDDRIDPLAGLAALLAVTSSPLSAQTAPKVLDSGVDKPASAIFIGNSFFYYNNSLHNHLSLLLRAANPNSRFRATSVTISRLRLRLARCRIPISG